MTTTQEDLIRLVRVDFDSLENHDPLTETEIGIFASAGGRSAAGRVSDWFANQAPVKLYTGYNEQVYPQWRLETKRLL
jgi:hypothetical protein